ncbi:hypothetical protein F2Q68_00006205 [Brassica cretica]|uniref:Uncharacterized protein n=1 Tax=Brassica cretica TaxID=69181 RepID=A0A8S9JFW3_BRACR|nr:hypothetical protein F2Q68_00006205 [Brassica cretica]
MASLGEIEESNDLVNHIRSVFRYFIVDVVDHGSTPDVTCCGRELEHRLIDSWSPRLEEERHMKKLSSETEETRKVKEIFSLQEKKKNRWTFYAAAAQVYGGRIHESVESVEMISNYEIRVSLEFSRVQESTTVFSEGFHGVLGLNLHGISVAGGVLIYVGISARYLMEFLDDMSVSWLFQMVFFNQREGCCRRVEGDRFMRCGFLSRYVFGVTHSFLLEWICENEELLVRGRVRLNGWRCQIEIDSGWKHGFWFEAVVIQVLQELQVSIDISWKFWRRRISRFVVTITTTTTSETEEETFTEDDLKARDGVSAGVGLRVLGPSHTSIASGPSVLPKPKLYSQISTSLVKARSWPTSMKPSCRQSHAFVSLSSCERKTSVSTLSLSRCLSSREPPPEKWSRLRSPRDLDQLCRTDVPLLLRYLHHVFSDMIPALTRAPLSRSTSSVNRGQPQE